MQCASTMQARATVAGAKPARAAVVVRAAAEEAEGGRRIRTRFSGRPKQERPEIKHFMPLPKPAHLVYVKPTVAVVADVAARNSVGLKMTIGENQLERYVVEYYNRRGL